MPEILVDRLHAASSVKVPQVTKRAVMAPAFGDQLPGLFAADIEYSGSTSRHDYLVRVRHRLLDTTFTVVIDGAEHDPKAEAKARPPEQNAAENQTAESDGGGAPERDTAADDAAADDDLRFTVKDGLTTRLCTVHRPRDGGEHVSAEDITIRTVGLGGAGEVDIRHGFKRIVLVPADGSPSAIRDEKRTAHPTRYALVAAISKSARYLLPLLGLGALFSGLLDPPLNWIEARVSPALEAIARMTAPVREWIAALLRPIQEFLEAVFSPVREFFAALLQPVRDVLAWLLGLLPDIGLPFDVPGWLVDLLVPAIVVVAAFSATRKGLHSRGEKLAAARASNTANTAKAAGTGAAGTGGEGPAVSGRDGKDEPPMSGEPAASESSDPAPVDRSSTDPLLPQR